MKKIIMLVLVSLITVLALVYALWDVDFHELGCYPAGTTGLFFRFCFL